MGNCAGHLPRHRRTARCQKALTTDEQNCPTNSTIRTYGHLLRWYAAQGSETSKWPELGIPDVELQVEAYLYPAHRHVLAEASPYFHAMFSSGMLEEKAKTIRLNGLDHDAMENVLNFMYCGSILVKDTESLKSLLSAAHMFLFDSLYRKCCQLFTCDDRLVSCFAEMWNLFELYSDENMTRHVVEYVKSIFSKIKFSNQLLLLKYEQMMTLVCKPCLSCSLNCSTDEVVQSVMYWGNKEHEDHLSDILSQVKLEYLSDDYLEQLHSQSLNGEHCGIQQIIAIAAATKMETRCSQTVLCFGNKQNHSYICIYRQKTDEWEKRVLPFILSTGMAVAYYDKHLYFIGGKYQSVQITVINDIDVLKYCPDNNAVWSVRCVHAWKYRPGVAVFGSRLFVVGGETSQGTLQDAGWFDALANTWQPVVPTLVQHKYPQVVPAKNQIFVVGELDNYSIVEQYNPDSDQWTQLTPTPKSIQSPELHKRHSLRIGVARNRLYVLREKQALYVYNFYNKKWETLALVKKLPYTAWCYIWSGAGEKQPYLMIRDVWRNLHKFHPATNRIERLCRHPDGISWHWWHTVFCKI